MSDQQSGRLEACHSSADGSILGTDPPSASNMPAFRAGDRAGSLQAPVATGVPAAEEAPSRSTASGNAGLVFLWLGARGQLFNKGIDLAVYKTPSELLGTVPLAAVATRSPPPPELNHAVSPLALEVTHLEIIY